MASFLFRKYIGLFHVFLHPQPVVNGEQKNKAGARQTQWTFHNLIGISHTLAVNGNLIPNSRLVREQPQVTSSPICCNEKMYVSL
jgi:hypothetical protein